MKLVLDLTEITEGDRPLVGGKAFALARMAADGLPVPAALCVGTEAYRRFVDATGLRARVLMEYHRKDFEQMRWEEMWDAALRIQNMFLRTDLPAELASRLGEEIKARFGDRPLVVRSSAVGEDSARASFAGLHESYVNVRGVTNVLDHVKLVWASLWSDAAMLYRREIGLDVEQSTMAVVVQELVQGERSGIVFGRSPHDETLAMVEAVYGLNQGLVDGTIEPDRWTVRRRTGRIVSFVPAQRQMAVAPDKDGTSVVMLSPARRRRPPLSDGEVNDVFGLEKRLERVFGSAQDVEWTYRRGCLGVLQSRPITTGVARDEDDRQWYLSLRRSLDNLKALRSRIEGDLIPGMIAAADELAGGDLTGLNQKELAREVTRRRRIYEEWKRIYWDDFIPFAHGFRLFGQIYNRTLKPDDPYEFTELLASTPLVSVERNRRMQELARMVREDAALAEALRTGRSYEREEFKTRLDAFMRDFDNPELGPSSFGESGCGLETLLLQMADSPGRSTEAKPRNQEKLEGRFLDAFPRERRGFARELLDLARISYKLRDDDNIYMGRIEAQVMRALGEAARRCQRIARLEVAVDDADEISHILLDPSHAPKAAPRRKTSRRPDGIRPRQLLGQPAGAGVATGPARVIGTREDLLAFNRGDVLVCDAIDPNMTFVVPMSAAVVERRGGMLIHGAIIAREYGLPCVTGIPDATAWIRTGDRITVDGYLGIVTIDATET
jgi:pyruvate,water dikinase